MDGVGIEAAVRVTRRRMRAVRAVKGAFCAAAAAAPLALTLAALSFPPYIALTTLGVCIATASIIAASLPVSPSNAAILIDSKLKTKERLISALAVTARTDPVASLIRQQAEAVARPVTPALKLPHWAVLAVWLYLPAALVMLTSQKTASDQHPLRLKIIAATEHATKSLRKRLRREVRKQTSPSRKRLLHLANASEREVKHVRRLLTDPRIATLLSKIAAGKGGGTGEGIGKASETIRRAAAAISINKDLAALLRQLADALNSHNRAAVKRLLSEINASVSSISRTVQQVRSIVKEATTPVPGEGQERDSTSLQKRSAAERLATQTQLALLRAERYPPALKAAVIRYFKRLRK